MSKKIFSILGLIFLIPIGLVGLLLLIVGMVEGMVSMLICGIIITLLSIFGCIYCGKKVPKVNKTQSKDNTIKQNGSNKYSKSNISNCIICNKEISGTIHPKAFGGYVCRNCAGLLSKQGISTFKLDNYSLTKLKRLCGVTEPVTNPILLDDNLTQAEKLQRLVISNPTISLQTGEECYYQYEATAYHEKNIVTGHKSSGAGVSFRVAKGVYARTGGGVSQVVRENVGEYFDGMLYITNFRVVLLTPKYGFDIPLSKITQIENHYDGFQIYSGAKCHSLLTIDVLTILVILKLIEIVNGGQLSSNKKISNTNAKSKSIDSSVNDLRELKKLFDEGVITEEEFNAKKKQLLGL